MIAVVPERQTTADDFSTCYLIRKFLRESSLRATTTPFSTVIGAVIGPKPVRDLAVIFAVKHRQIRIFARLDATLCGPPAAAPTLR